MRRLPRVLFLLLLASTSGLAAGTLEIGPEQDLARAFASIPAGTNVVLLPGVYDIDGNLSLMTSGSAMARTRVAARSPGTVLLRQATDRHNVLEIRDSRYLVISGIRITGGSHGIRLINSDFVTIEDTEIFATGDVALSANAGGTYENLIIRRNHIHHTGGTGEGMYLGCNHDRCRVANSLIEYNYVHHTDGPTVQQGDGIELKEGSYGNVIRRNRIHNTRYPGILVYGTRGNGAVNIIEGNIVWASGDNTVQIAADAVFRNNIVLGNVAIQPHQSARPANIRLVHNTIIHSSAALSIRGSVGRIDVANNAIFSRSQAIRVVGGGRKHIFAVGNVGVGRTVGLATGYTEGDGLHADVVDGHYRGEPPINVAPRRGGALIDAGAYEFAVASDFRGCLRSGTVDAGALRSENDEDLIRPGAVDNHGVSSYCLRNTPSAWIRR